MSSYSSLRTIKTIQGVSRNVREVVVEFHIDQPVFLVVDVGCSKSSFFGDCLVTVEIIRVSRDNPHKGAGCEHPSEIESVCRGRSALG